MKGLVKTISPSFPMRLNKLEALRRAVDDKDMVGFAPHIREAYEKAAVDFDLNGDPQRIDMILDGAVRLPWNWQRM